LSLSIASLDVDVVVREETIPVVALSPDGFINNFDLLASVPLPIVIDNVSAIDCP
jgi:hypothetical protein